MVKALTKPLLSCWCAYC